MKLIIFLVITKLLQEKRNLNRIIMEKINKDSANRTSSVIYLLDLGFRHRFCDERIEVFKQAQC